MIKKTLHFGNPAYLSTNLEQLVVDFPDKDKKARTVPIEDVGLIILEHRQITITNTLITKLLANKAVILNCDEKHLPIGMFLPTVGHTEQTERQRYQLQSSLALRKGLWQQTIKAKISNQAALLEDQGMNANTMKRLAREVKSGDPDNLEAQAAAYYWRRLFNDEHYFVRDRDGQCPNDLLNYGYAILRGIVARSLAASGFVLSVGIHHRSKYNAFCLVDDIMEPYRPYLDALVCEMIDHRTDMTELNPVLKKELLAIASMEVLIDKRWTDLMKAVDLTVHSLYECFAGKRRKLLYPEFYA